MTFIYDSLKQIPIPNNVLITISIDDFLALKQCTHQ